MPSRTMRASLTLLALLATPALAVGPGATVSTAAPAAPRTSEGAPARQPSGLDAAPAGAPAPFELPPAPAGETIRYRADHFEYEGSTMGADAQMLLRGDVEMESSTWTLRAGEVRLDMRTRRARATEGFEIDDGLTVLHGNAGDFDLGANTGKVEDVKAEYPPWRIWAWQGELDAERKGHFRRTLFTSCDGSPPHYHFRSSRLHVKPGKWLAATNVRFYLGKVPVFYSPFLWKSLKEKHIVKTRVTPGYDRRNGPYARTDTMFNLTDWLYGRLFLDYYGSQGLATGSELQFHPSEDARGALYGYRIKEKGDGKERWTVLGNHYQALNSTYSIQGRFQAQSDPEVNNHYIRSNAFRVTSELVNGGALTRRTSLTTTRILYSRRDTANAAGDGFVRASESYPRLEIQTAQLSIRRLPVLFTLNGFADNNYSRARGFLQRSVGAGVEATQTKRIVRGVSLTPKAAYREVYEDRRDAPAAFSSTRTYHDSLTGFYLFGTNLRVDTPIGDWDAGYTFERRLKPDTVRDDAGAPDHGMERNVVTLQNTFRPRRKVLVRVGTGYDFRIFRDRDLDFQNRVVPFTADLILLPKRGVQVTLRDQYKLGEGNRAFLVQTDFGDRDASFIGAGVTHTRDRPRTYFSSLDVGWRPKKISWKLGGALRNQMHTPGGFDLRGFQVFEKEIWVSRRWHDFFTRALVRFRPGGVKEGHIRIELRYKRWFKRRKKRKNWEDEWFPWRKNRTSDDRE